MLILFNKAISVACFAMKCWQFFLLPHFSQSIDADTNVSAAHSFKLQTKIGWDWQWGDNPQCSRGGQSSVSAPLLSPANVPTLSSCWGTPHLLCGWEMSPGDIQPCSGCRGHCWHPSLQNPLLLLQASAISSVQPRSFWNSKLHFTWGIWNPCPKPGPSLESPWVSHYLSPFRGGLGRLSSSFTFIFSLLICIVAWKSWILFGGYLSLA